ncbi:MAG: hypothetical protein GY847_07205 [Proteobacteria bacterium]|nr:hypothetical protein [Pseudomonadota bacterium]
MLRLSIDLSNNPARAGGGGCCFNGPYTRARAGDGRGMNDLSAPAKTGAMGSEAAGG